MGCSTEPSQPSSAATCGAKRSGNGGSSTGGIGGWLTAAGALDAEAVAEALGDDGHQADIAGDGAVALEMLDRRTYDLVISDTKMPVLDGESFYGELERRFPQLRGRIIFLTGDVLSREKREFLARSGAPFLMKPFDLDELRQTVQRTLAGTPSSG